MKINSTNLSFKSVILVGSIPQNKQETFDNLVENQRLARIISNKLEEQNQDTFIIESSIKDARGKSTDRINTYVLTDKDAKIVKKYDDIKLQLQKLFAKDIQSDGFVSSLDHKIDAISKEQLSTAQFIAENKLQTAKEVASYQ